MHCPCALKSENTKSCETQSTLWSDFFIIYPDVFLSQRQESTNRLDFLSLHHKMFLSSGMLDFSSKPNIWKTGYQNPPHRTSCVSMYAARSEQGRWSSLGAWGNCCFCRLYACRLTRVVCPGRLCLCTVWAFSALWEIIWVTVIIVLFEIFNRPWDFVKKWFPWKPWDENLADIIFHSKWAFSMFWPVSSRELFWQTLASSACTLERLPKLSRRISKGRLKSRCHFPKLAFLHKGPNSGAGLL